MMFPRRGFDPHYDITKKVVARVHEEIYVEVKKARRERFRNILSHKPVNAHTALVYLDGALLFEGETRDYQIENQTIYVRRGLFTKGEHTLLIRYDYLGDL